MIEQTIIALCGITSVWLSQDRRPHYARWACIIGLCAQPFWLFATWKAQQYGIFLLSFVYALGWLRGVKTYWINP